MESLSDQDMDIENQSPNMKVTKKTAPKAQSKQLQNMSAISQKTTGPSFNQTSEDYFASSRKQSFDEQPVDHAILSQNFWFNISYLQAHRLNDSAKWLQVLLAVSHNSAHHPVEDKPSKAYIKAEYREL